jgi:anti-sigma factor RsiW
MTECPESRIRDLLPELLHDRLSPADLAEVERHVASCALCRSELQLLQEARSALDPGVQIDPSAIAMAVQARLATPRARVRGRIPRGARQLAAAAAVVLFAGTTYMVSRGGAPSLGDSARVESVRAVAREPAAAVASAEILLETSRVGLTDSDLVLLARQIEAFDGLPAEAPTAVVEFSNLPEVW